MNVKPFTMADFPAAHALWSRCFPNDMAEYTKDHVARFLLRNEGCSQVVYDGDTLIGCALCGHDGRRGMVYHLAVLETARRQGVGRALLNACKAALKDQGIGKICLVVFRENATALKFYQDEGLDLRDDLVYFNMRL